MFAQLINRINRTGPSDDHAVSPTPAAASDAAASAAASALLATDALLGDADASDERRIEQRALIHLAIDWVDAPLAFFDRNRALQFVNAAYAGEVGRPRDTLIGVGIDDAVPASGGLSADAVRAYAERALAGESVDIDLAHRSDGAIDGLARLQYRPQARSDGTIVGALCVMHRLGRRVSDQRADAGRDAAGRQPLDGPAGAPIRAALRLAHDDVAERERKQRELIGGLPLPLVFIGNDGLCRWGNAAFARVFGLAERDIVGMAVDGLGGVPKAAVRRGLARAALREATAVDERLTLGGGAVRRYRLDFLPGYDRDDVQNGAYMLVTEVGASAHHLTTAPPSPQADTRRATDQTDDARIRFLVDHVPAQIMYVDRDLRYRYCNRRFLEDYGFDSLDHLLGKTPDEVFGPGTIESVREHIDAALRGDRAYYERAVPTAAGEQRWLSVTAMGDFAEDGTVRGIYSIASDITMSRRAADVRANEQRLIDEFTENFPQALCYLDGDGIHRHTNRAYEDFAGRPKAAILGQSGSQVFGGDVAGVFLPAFRRARDGERLRTEHDVALPGAPTRTYAADWLPDVAADGSVRGVYVSLQEVGDGRLARLAYEESLREMQRAMDSVALPISFVDREQRLRFVNRTTTAWHGRSSEELIGVALAELMSDDDYRFAKPYIQSALGGESVQYEREMRYHDGVRRWVLIRYVATRDETGAVNGFYTTATDIQSRKQQEIALQQANGLLTAHFENTPLASFTLDGAERVTRWSSQAELLFGWLRDDAIHRTFDQLELVDRAKLGDFVPTDRDADNPVGNRRLHIVDVKRRDGTTVTCEWHIAALRDASGRIASTLALVQDVSQRVEAERRLTEIAHRDTLTRLLNRNALEPTLRAFIERARQNGSGVAVLFLDLDHFKNINDTLGHRVGDLMLIEVASILRRSVRADDEVARIGGDEFMVVIGHKSPKAIAHETAQRILAALSTPIRVDNQRLSVTSSIGIAIYPDHGRAPEALIRSADLAMYRAKENGKNRFEFFSAALAQHSERRSAVKGALKIALQKDALRLYFQPRVRIADGRIVGAEVLLRWTDPRLGVVSPKEFIVIAEETGLIHELGLYVFRKACRQLRDWQDRGISLGILSVNFSAHQLLVATFTNEVDDVIGESGIDPRSIEVEITETSMLFDLGVTRSVIADLKARGMRIAIDDFGTGFSSLSHLQQLDVDTLKIDQSFIRDMLHDAGDAAITTSVISLARGLGLSTTAEGVEQELQLDVLREAGCDYYQGFLFSPAIVVEDLETLLVAQGELDPA